MKKSLLFLLIGTILTTIGIYLMVFLGALSMLIISAVGILLMGYAFFRFAREL